MAARRPHTTPHRGARAVEPSGPRTSGDASRSSERIQSASTDDSVEVQVPTFADLGVHHRVVQVLEAEGITRPFPIQTATLPDSISGRDVLGRGRTGSGKTLAFLLPMLTRLATSGAERRPRHPRALILAPTRELVNQIRDAALPLAEALGLRVLTVFGGVSQVGQVNGFRRGVDVVIACPGRLEDHMGQRNVRLDSVEITVLDEADHMADLGFLPGVTRILDATPSDSQRLLFSATLDNGVDVLVKRFLTDPVTHSVDPPSSPVEAMDHHVLHVTTSDRLSVLVELVSRSPRTIVFTRTKHRAKTLARQLNGAGVPSVEMHGNLAQTARVRNLAAFAAGRASVLVATDIAARGIHVDDVELVVHADPPVEHKAYLHRSGRTARAGARGTVVTIATEQQRRDVKQLTRKAGIDPTVTPARPGDDVIGVISPGEPRILSAEAVTASLQEPASRSGGQGNGSRPPRKPHQPGSPGRSRQRRDGRRRDGARPEGGPRSDGGREGARAGARSGGGRPDGARSDGARPGGNRSGGRPDGGRARSGGAGSPSGRPGGSRRSGGARRPNR